MLFRSKPQMVDADTALPGRDEPEPVTNYNIVLDEPIMPPFPSGTETIYFAMGCFWGAERIYWQTPGVFTTAVGYMGGWTKNPTYEETCTGRTGHTETVMVVYEPAKVSLGTLLKAFWENHDPTTANRQGNDIGTQYRSAVFTTTDAQLAEVDLSAAKYQAALADNGFGAITTQIAPAAEAGDGQFYYAEDYHQQYLEKHPSGYCNHGFCQVGYDLEAHGQAARATLDNV